jgi:isoleucyl-tRNA synthetase
MSSTPWWPSCSCTARKTWAVFYLDVLKDRLYTTAPKSLARRSAQTALWQITHAMLRWMAPFLSFTAEEAWKVFGTPTRSSWRPSGPLGRRDDAALLAKWARIREIRDVVNKDIEALRAAGQVGSSLQANVTLTVAPEDHALLASLGDDLKFVFITSAIELIAGSALQVSVKPVRCQMRALLALPRRCGPRCGPPHPVRPLHQQPLWRGEDRKVA